LMKSKTSSQLITAFI
jgi:sodium/potassium-transporting ATPase subunit alpha